MTERSSLHTKYKSRITELLDLGPYITPAKNRKIPFLNLYTFEEAFSCPLVWKLLKKVHARKSDYVFDPFCGSGTTLFASFAKGIPSVGVDALPFAWFMSKTLPHFLFLEKGKVNTVWKTLLPLEMWEPAPAALDVPLMKVAFEDDILLRLRRLKTAVSSLEEPFNDIFLYLFFSIIPECSRTEKRKRYPRVILNKKGVDPVEAMGKKVAKVEADIERSPYKVCRENLPHVFVGDTRDSPYLERPPTIVITSPPYPDKIDYTRSYALELCFHFVKDFREFKKMRHTLLRSHIESRVEKEELPHPAVEEVVNKLKEKTITRIPEMLTGYFQDIRKAIKAWFDLTGESAQVVLVLENLVYDTESIPVDLILCDIGDETGFTVDKIIVTHYKEKEGLILRESILLWRK